MFCHRVYSIVTCPVRHPFGKVKITFLVGLVGGCFPFVGTVVVTVAPGKSGL